MQRRRWITAGLLVVMIAAVIGITIRQVIARQASPYPGHPVPVFTLTTLQDHRSLSTSELRGQPLVINFWASWCPPCQMEQPLLVQAYHKHGGQVRFIGVNVTSGDNLAKVEAFAAQYGVPYPIALDTTGAVSQHYQVVALPTTLFVNREGVIVDRVTGMLTPDRLQKDLELISR